MYLSNLNATITVRLPTELREFLFQICDSQNITPSLYIRALIQHEYIKMGDYNNADSETDCMYNIQHK